VVNFILEKQQEVGVGDSVGVPECKTKYKVSRVLAPVELKRLKKEFLAISKLHPPKSKALFAETFLEFLETSGERE